MKSKQLPLMILVFTLAAVVSVACSQPPPPTESAATEEPDSAATEEALDLPLAPDADRVDLDPPTFSNPTNVTNPLFPISDLHSVLLLGNIDGHPFRTETTLLAETKTIEWNGQQIETLVSQYTAYLDGRIEEVALDFYAQADDGSVWYFGEDVFNYVDGQVADTEGTWITGGDVPPAMIMPADPQEGDVYRPENYFPVVFEEVTVMSINVTVDGPQGPVDGAIVADELHMDGAHENKVFAPGYGEFSSGAGGDLEALALAVPTDALSGVAPLELDTLYSGAVTIFDAAESGDWDAASAAYESMAAGWEAVQAGGGVPPLLDAAMTHALDALAGDVLAPALEARNPGGTRRAALDVAQATLDLQLRYRPPTEIDSARFKLWTLKLLADSGGEDAGPVLGDVTVLEWIWQRFGHILDSADVGKVEALLDELRAAADNEDLAAAAEIAQQLRETLNGME